MIPLVPPKFKKSISVCVHLHILYMISLDTLLVHIWRMPHILWNLPLQWFVYFHMHIFEYIFSNFFISSHANILIYIWVCVCVDVCMCMCMSVLYMCTSVYMWVSICFVYMYACAYVYIFLYLSIYTLFSPWYSNVCMFIYRKKSILY